jgi:hypothetical protein
MRDSFDVKGTGSSLLAAFASGPESVWAYLEPAVCAAAEIFARVGAGEALAKYARLVAAFSAWR